MLTAPYADGRVYPKQYKAEADRLCGEKNGLDSAQTSVGCM
jgi:hypothetical protein